MATHSSILAGASHGQRSLVGYSPWGRKELDVTEQGTLFTSSLSGAGKEEAGVTAKWSQGSCFG